MTQSTVSGDLSARRKRSFLTMLTQHNPPQSHISISGFRSGEFLFEVYPKADLRSLLSRVRTYDENGFDTYVGTTALRAKPRQGRGTREDFLGSSVLWVDIDVKGEATLDQAWERLNLLLTPPTWINKSGAGLHAFWALSELCLDSEAIEGRNRWLAKQTGGDHCWSVTQVLRIPGTHNYKYDPPREVTVELETDRVYDLAEIPYSPREPGEKDLDTNIDQEPLPDNFLDQLSERLRHRIVSGAGATTTADGDIDRSANDWYVVQELLRIGFSPGVCVSVLTHPTWFSGSKARETTYGYAEYTVASAVLAFKHKPTPTGENGTFATTDSGNAQRLAARYGDRLRYVWDMGRWLCWSDKYWYAEPKDGGFVVRCAIETVRSIYAEAATQPSSEARERLAKHAFRSESASSLYSMVRLATTEPSLQSKVADFDSNPWLMSCANGTVDLETGKLREHRASDMLTRQATASYRIETAGPTRWLAFLRRVLSGDESLVAFMQRALGYTLTGDTREQSLFLLYGTGSNGKTTFLETVKRMLGSYAATVDFESITEQHGAVRNDLARLTGVRMAAIDEANAGSRLNESIIKRLSGQNEILARFLYAENFEFTPVHKIWLASNHKPIIKGQDPAIWRRILLVPFTVEIKGAEIDKLLREKLSLEMPDIFAWCVEGTLRWREQGLNPPERVLAAVQEYREQMDTLTEFFRDWVETDGEYRESAKNLYQAYCSFCDEHREKPESQMRFGLTLNERGFSRVPWSQPVQWSGLRIKPGAAIGGGSIRIVARAN